MERLKNENCVISFKENEEMKEFLDEMEETDKELELCLFTIRTYEKNGELYLEGWLTNGGGCVQYPIWPFAIKSLEKRSGDTAKGHELMTNAQILESMNNYWPLHNEKKVVTARVRGGKILGLGSQQYEFISQNEILASVTAWLDNRHPGAYSFMGGEYSHQLTRARYEINDAISATYRSAWKRAGLPENLLRQSKIIVNVLTDDTAECAAKAIIEMNVGGSRFLLGNPIEVVHRVGFGGIDTFITELEKADASIEQELNALAKLMDITLFHPEGAVIKALKKAKIPQISKKACKELIDNMLFGMTESAYVVYLFLHGVLDTSYGSALSEDRRLRIVCALRTLLYEDWTKFDVPASTL